MTIQNMVEASFISRLSKLIFILLPEAVTSWEEIPAPFLVHLPDVRLLAVGDGEEVVGHIFKCFILT